MYPLVVALIIAISILILIHFTLANNNAVKTITIIAIQRLSLF